MNNHPAVKVENLTKTFDGKELIKNCNMTVPKGTIYGFLGVNGAGKTTVFKMLSGLLTPTMGNVKILDMDVISQRSEVLRNIGTIIETPIFYEHLSAIENLEIHLAYMEGGDTDIDSVLTQVGLTNTGKQPVSKFSLGMRQRLAIARAIIHKPKLLILDEPINGLDPIGIREMRELFLDLVHTEEITVLISGHILSEIEHLADTIGVIVNGSVIQEVSLAKVKAEYPNGLEDFFMEIMNGRISDA
ncbi:ABC-2 type transport system ATP-binding protein [Sporosarcina luteola]|nr:ABC-2 type transport system ATP-binding protein [Sporosarcina luteola]